MRYWHRTSPMLDAERGRVGVMSSWMDTDRRAYLLKLVAEIDRCVADSEELLRRCELERRKRELVRRIELRTRELRTNRPTVSEIRVAVELLVLLD